MKNFLSIFSTSVLSFTILAGIVGNAYANSEFDEVTKFGFTTENKLDGDELSGLRGGMRIGTLDFDFAITTRTMVDGVLQHTSTFNSSNLENNSLKDIAQNTAKQLVTEVVPSNPVPVSVTPNNGETPANVNNSPSNPSSNVPSVVAQSGNLSNGVGVTINTGSLATTIQNSNDNAVIQQQNQMDLVVSNLSAVQKLNIAQQMDFLAAQSK